MFFIKFQYFLSIILVLSLFQNVQCDFFEQNNSTEEKFVINNEACKLPYQDPWLLQSYYINKSYVPCKQKKPFTTFERKNDIIYAILDPFRIKLYKSRSMEVTCCISNVTRSINTKIPDNKTKESRCLVFDKEGKAEVNNPIVKIRCFKTNKNSSIQAYENIYAFYLPEKLPQNFTDTEKALNVLLVGIGSMSRQNVLRTWPETYNYLIETGWLSYEGYSQVGDKTIGNILPMLTGYSEKQSYMIYSGDFYDNYNFIWKDFKNNGYITSFAEDHSQYSIFNNEKNGFLTPPADYYFKPFNTASEKLQTSVLDHMPHCIGNENAAEKILNLSKDFVKTFKTTPYFGFFWLKTFTSEDINAPGRMDKKLLNFFKSIQPYINNTVIFFFSDHGFTENNFTSFKVGWMESRQPFLYVYLPENFRLKFKTEWEHAQQNSHRLTSPYDLYMTLGDIIKLSERNYGVANAKSCQKCNSFFEYIPEVRSCSDAGIENEFCLCSDDSSSQNFTMIIKAVKSGKEAFNRTFKIVGFVVFAFMCDVLIDRVL